MSDPVEQNENMDGAGEARGEARCCGGRKRTEPCAQRGQHHHEHHQGGGCGGHGHDGHGGCCGRHGAHEE